MVEGLDLARSRREGVKDRDLARGPARLAMTLALSRDQNGIDTIAVDSPLVIRAAGSRPGQSAAGGPPSGSWVPAGSAQDPPTSTRPIVVTGPRVGVSGPGGDAAAYPWRFWLEGEPTVSVYRPGKVRPPKPANGSRDR